MKIGEGRTIEIFMSVFNGMFFKKGRMKIYWRAKTMIYVSGKINF